MCPNLTLAKLRQILRAHYKQKSGTELYQELSVLCQGTKESAQDFLICAMNLRQVIFASNAIDCGIKYETALVQSLFIHVVETGLQQESVQAKLRPLLDKKGVTDEELLEQLNKAVSAESERNNKMGTVKHNQVSVNMTSCNDSTNENKSSSKEAKQNKLMAALEAVQADVASLPEAFHKTQVTQMPNQDSARSVFRHNSQKQK